MSNTSANEIVPHLPLIFENEANGILQDLAILHRLWG